MLFSIIIPAYNVEKYLLECLASVDAQTFRDYEVVIVDDGSTDETAYIADTYAGSKSNVTVLHRENQGPLLARRAGLKIARGQYAVFVDSDDGLHPEALQCIHDAITGTDADIVSFRYCRSKDFGRSDTPSPLSTGLYSGKEITEGRKHLCEGRFNEMWGKAIRLNLFDLSADYTQHNKIKHGEDLLQLLPVFDKARSLCSLDDVLYFYRPNDTASTSAYKPSQLSDIRVVNRALLKYARKWGESCYQNACAGEALQYINLLKIAMQGAGYSGFIQVFRDVREAAQDEKCFSRWKHCSLRADNRLTVFLLKRGFGTLTFELLKAVDFIKKIRRR